MYFGLFNFTPVSFVYCLLTSVLLCVILWVVIVLGWYWFGWSCSCFCFYFVLLVGSLWGVSCEINGVSEGQKWGSKNREKWSSGMGVLQN